MEEGADLFFFDALPCSCDLAFLNLLIVQFYRVCTVKQVLTIQKAILLLLHDGIIRNIPCSFLIPLFYESCTTFKYPRHGLHAEWAHTGDFQTVCADKITKIKLCLYMYSVYN